MSTRFYFPASAAAGASPGYDSAWGYNSEAVRRKLASVKGSSVLAQGTRIGPWTSGSKALDRQYVSDPIAAQTISGTVKMQILAREYDSADNVGIVLGIRVVSGNGSTVRGTLLSVGAYGPSTELSNTGYRNKTGADGDSLTSVTAQAGDRIVVEIGYADFYGSSPEASAKWGENASDLPENETQTADGAAWIEFSGTITMYSNNITGAGAIASAEACGEPSLEPGQVDIEPVGIASAEAFGYSSTPGLIEPSGIASAETFGAHHVNNIVFITDAGGIASAEAFGRGEIRAVIYPEDEGSTTRTIEVVRVGSINLKTSYPGKQVVRLRDLSALYEGKRLAGLDEVAAAVKRYQRKRDLDNADNLAAGVEFLSRGIEDLYARMRGTRLSRVNVDVWDQISGAYLGAYGTDKHGTLILPIDTPFVEVLQWKIAGAGYSDAFNGERAAGTPGLFFYFPCNEGEGTEIASFSGVSAQKAEWNGDWHDEGLYNRPALKTSSGEGSSIELLGIDPRGQHSFQFLWYCNDPSSDYSIFSYSAFNLKVKNGKLYGTVPEASGGVGHSKVYGTTTLQAETWYLIQINTTMWERWNNDSLVSNFEYFFQMDVYLGGALELKADTGRFVRIDSMFSLSNIVTFSGEEGDGFDELRHLDRLLYKAEIADYARFLRNGRIQGKAEGNLGNIDW